MIGWLIALAVLVLLWFLPLGVRGIYNDDGPSVWLRIGPFRKLVYPKKSTTQPEQQTMPAKKKGKTAATADKKSGGSLTDFFPLVKLILALLGDFRKKLQVKRLDIKLIMAGSDPCDLAVNYGKTWAVVGSLFPQLERVFVIKKRNVEVECDFTSENTLIFAHIVLSITLGQILCLGVRHGVGILKEFLKIIKMRKGGTNHESESS